MSTLDPFLCLNQYNKLSKLVAHTLASLQADLINHVMRCGIIESDALHMI
jgi:hypothetical protein